MLFTRNDSEFCHFEPFVKRRKIHTTCHFEWVKRATQRVARRSRSKKIHIVILSVSEISTEFKTHFEFKVKNPRLKGTNLRFEFMDTSLSCESSVWQEIAKYDKTQVSMTRVLSLRALWVNFARVKRLNFITPKCLAVSFLVRLRCKKCLNLA